MKKLIISIGIGISISALLSFNLDSQKGGSKFVVPEQVKTILDKSCLPCHGVDGNGKAKMKWNYAKMPGMKSSKMVGRLSKIVSKVESGKMPTAKFIERNPDKKLTDADKKALIDWANGLVEDLTK